MSKILKCQKASRRKKKNNSRRRKTLIKIFQVSDAFTGLGLETLALNYGGTGRGGGEIH